MKLIGSVLVVLAAADVMGMGIAGDFSKAWRALLLAAVAFVFLTWDKAPK
jgi:hypothetical protein